MKKWTCFDAGQKHWKTPGFERIEGCGFAPLIMTVTPYVLARLFAAQVYKTCKRTTQNISVLRSTGVSEHACVLSPEAQYSFLFFKMFQKKKKHFLLSEVCNVNYANGCITQPIYSVSDKTKAF